MEENSKIYSHYHNQLVIRKTINNLLQNAVDVVQRRRVSLFMKKHLPKTYLGYISNVSRFMLTQRDPKNHIVHQKMMTQPAEGCSYQPHIQVPFTREFDLPDQMDNCFRGTRKEERQGSLCLTVRSRQSNENGRSRKLNSRRKIQVEQPFKLIPLQLSEAFEDEQSRKCDEDIDMMRLRKIKVQEALKRFNKTQNKQNFHSMKSTRDSAFNQSSIFKGKATIMKTQESQSKFTETILPTSYRVDGCNTKTRFKVQSREKTGKKINIGRRESYI